jgi:hypothetical protein
MAVAMGALVITGCGARTTAAGPPGNPVPSRCVTPKLTAPGKTFTITEKDSGKTYCVIAGTKMFVFLHSSPSRMWSPIHASSAALQPQPSGIFTLARGVTAAHYLAARLGRTTVESRRVPCHPTTEANHATCGAANVFRVTILIRGKM